MFSGGSSRSTESDFEPNLPMDSDAALDGEDIDEVIEHLFENSTIHGPMAPQRPVAHMQHAIQELTSNVTEKAGHSSSLTSPTRKHSKGPKPISKNGSMRPEDSEFAPSFEEAFERRFIAAVVKLQRASAPCHGRWPPWLGHRHKPGLLPPLPCRTFPQAGNALSPELPHF